MLIDSFIKPETFLTGTWVLGFNQKQNGSVLQAGTRAVLSDSPLLKALSNSQGRIAAQAMMMMGIDIRLMNYAALRPHAIMEVIRRMMPSLPSGDQSVILDPCTGYGAEYIWLAEEYPHCTFLEMDRPDIIQQKQKRLKAFKLPQNIQLLSADLQDVTLQSALEGRSVDLIALLPTYVSHTQFIETLKYVRQTGILKPGGVVLAPFTYQIGFADFARASQIFKRFASEPKGTVQTFDQIHEVFATAGYSDTQVFPFTELAVDLGKPTPFDLEVVSVGRL